MLHTMQLIVLFFLLWAALTSACYLPFNDPRLSNTTLLAKFLANATYGSVVDKGGSGYMTTIEKDSPRQSWPVHGSPPRADVPFCYWGQGDKD
jgi:hypothetical protein